MDLTKVFDDVTWANVVIEKDELKSIQEFSVKELKHKDLHSVWSQLKIKGVTNTRRSQCLRRLLVFTSWMKGMVGSRMAQSWLSHHKERIPSALTDYLTFYFGIRSEAFTSHSELYDNLHFEDDEVLSDLHHINFKEIVQHD